MGVERSEVGTLEDRGFFAVQSRDRGGERGAGTYRSMKRRPASMIFGWTDATAGLNFAGGRGTRRRHESLAAIWLSF